MVFKTENRFSSFRLTSLLDFKTGSAYVCLLSDLVQSGNVNIAVLLYIGVHPLGWGAQWPIG